MGTGFINSFRRPGGNITGLSLLEEHLGGKRLELLKVTLPSMSRAVALANRGHVDFEAAAAAAKVLGVHLQLAEVYDPDQLEQVLESATRQDVEALMVMPNAVTISHARWIAEYAKANSLPTISERAEFAQAGGLMAYGPSSRDLWQRAAAHVDKILKGTSPAELPVEQPMTFDFVVNMRTARELGITFPHEVALQITEVIQ